MCTDNSVHCEATAQILKLICLYVSLSVGSTTPSISVTCYKHASAQNRLQVYETTDVIAAAARENEYLSRTRNEHADRFLIRRMTTTTEHTNKHLRT